MRKLILALIICTLLPVASFAKIAVIANKDLKTSSINKAKLLDIYTLDISEIGGSKLKVFDYSSETPTKKSFFEALNKSISEFKQIWMKKKFTGNGNPPLNVGSEDDMVSKVASTPGAIGYVDADKVTSAVKVIMEIK